MKLLYISCIHEFKMHPNRPFILKYKVIKTDEQYREYAEVLASLPPQYAEDEIELLQLLISHWELSIKIPKANDPICLIKALMTENNLKAKDLVQILNLSKGTVSKILNYKKGLSKNSIRKLSEHFKLNQKELNQAYSLFLLK